MAVQKLLATASNQVDNWGAKIALGSPTFHIPLMERYMKQTELAWAAGFFDGEGSSCICKRKNWEHTNSGRRLLLHITQTGPDSLFHLQRFQRAVSQYGIISILNQSTRNKNWANGYQWGIEGIKNSVNVMKLLWKYLGPTKKKQFIKSYKEIKRFRRLNGRKGIHIQAAA